MTPAEQSNIGEGGARGWSVVPASRGVWRWNAWFRGDSRSGMATTEYDAKQKAQVAYSALVNEAAMRNIEGRRSATQSAPQPPGGAS